MSEIIVTPLGTVSPYPKNEKNCPGFFVEYENNKILIDCGNGCTRLLKFPDDINNLKIFISHLHPDHYGDLLSLIQAVKVYDRFGFLESKIDLYIPCETIKERMYYTDEDGWGASRTIETNPLDYKIIQKLADIDPINFKGYMPASIKFDDIVITSKEVPHQVSCYAIKVATPDGVIVYSSDTGTSNSLRNFAKDCDLFICESTFLKGQYRAEDAHLYAWEAASIAKDANVKKLLLTHFWPDIDKEKYLEEAIKIFENTEVAEEGKKLVLTKS